MLGGYLSAPGLEKLSYGGCALPASICLFSVEAGDILASRSMMLCETLVSVPDIVEIKTTDVVWPFDNSGPCVLQGNRREKVDPFPCYTHDYGLVFASLGYLLARWPLPFPVRLYLLPFEDSYRTNGWANMVCQDYSRSKELDAWLGVISLSGKRVPIHPAVTRYTVCHEYGHLVEEALVVAKGGQIGSDDKRIQKEYAELRGLAETNLPYGGGTWHKSVCEIFANDFRVLVCEVEKGFWPHPGIAPPGEVAGLQEWWDAVQHSPGAVAAGGAAAE